MHVDVVRGRVAVDHAKLLVDLYADYVRGVVAPDLVKHHGAAGRRKSIATDATAARDGTVLNLDEDVLKLTVLRHDRLGNRVGVLGRAGGVCAHVNRLRRGRAAV